MNIPKKYLTIIKWTTRIIAAATLLLGLPFYFGYGNPLPFANPNNSLFDNLWLFTFPLMFIGLGLGWKWEKIGGYLIVIPITLATIIGFIILKEGLPGPMFIPMIIGISYLILGYNQKKSSKN
ncbi:hypothetical protein HN587_02125 [Candidatus Woesearchaeota archaeon]|nr:hypothetical protein [Candidatus Woesearchaeota archaeon]